MRKPVQINEGRVLCNDGTIWFYGYVSPRGNQKEWQQLPPIPQDDSAIER